MKMSQLNRLTLRGLLSVALSIAGSAFAAAGSLDPTLETTGLWLPLQDVPSERHGVLSVGSARSFANQRRHRGAR